VNEGCPSIVPLVGVTVTTPLGEMFLIISVVPIGSAEFRCTVLGVVDTKSMVSVDNAVSLAPLTKVGAGVVEVPDETAKSKVTKLFANCEDMSSVDSCRLGVSAEG